ncbi:MAG: xanthine dehydrogenase family protein molybdopterin-binding subunit [Bacillota bacterium]
MQSEYSWVGSEYIRPDAECKVNGKLKYMSDLKFPNMLWGKVLWSEYPHAEIKTIDISEAEKIAGVVKVLTYQDIPGINGSGIVIKDRPVLCRDKVRYLGDALALVAAESKEAAEKAIEAIRVEYNPLPPVTDPVQALQDKGTPVHDDGNLYCRDTLVSGDVEQARQEADVIIKNIYKTPRQMHGYLETESGVGVPEADGVTVYCGSQACYRDREQIAAVLDLPLEKVRVISSPLGGGFGGKDDTTVEIYLALLARATGRPVKIILSREESVRTGMKKHPMEIHMETAVTSEGKLLGQDVKIYADTGAYLSLGRSVLYLTMEHSTGSYRVPHVRIEGNCVYTNNCIAGAFRGFGVNQAIFAVEAQMDSLAAELDLDPIEIRKLNILQQGDRHPLGQKIRGSVGALKTLEEAEKSSLWQKRKELTAVKSRPWKKRGVGIATALKCVGFGHGLVEQGRVKLKVLATDKFQVATSFEDMGQGNKSTYRLLAAEVLGCSPDRIEVVVGDTERTVDSGVTSASRATYLAGTAIIKAADALRYKLEKLADFDIAEEITIYELTRRIGKKAAGLVIDGSWNPPVADIAYRDQDTGRELMGIPHSVFSYMTQLVLVEVDLLTGKTEVLETEAVIEAGKVINPAGFRGQIEGGAAMGMGYALLEEVEMKEGRYGDKSLSSYLMPMVKDMPGIDITPVEMEGEAGPFGAKGMAELSSIPITPAIINAIADATGVRMKEIPAAPRRLLLALKNNKQEGK